MWQNTLFFLLIYFATVPSMRAQQSDTLDLYALEKETRITLSENCDNWEKTYFKPFLKKNRIKLSCAHCSSVFFEAVFKVQDDGHAHYEITRQKKCGQLFSKTQIQEINKLLIHLSIPRELSGKLVRLRFGDALKC